MFMLVVVDVSLGCWTGILYVYDDVNKSSKGKETVVGVDLQRC